MSISYFGAVGGAGQITVTWVTEVDLHNIGYNRERSADGQTWTPLASVPSQSPCIASNSTHTNTYVDKGLPAHARYSYRIQLMGQPCGERNTYYDRTVNATTGIGALERRLYLPFIVR